MFDTLSERLTRTLKSVSGKARLTDENIAETLREVRMALLEADVALPVVKTFVEGVRERAVGTEVSTSLSPGQQFVKIVQDELISVMGNGEVGLELAVKPPAVILMAGLQGSGKTTTVAKLARYLKERDKKRPMVVSTDVYRPAAIDQLETLAGEVGVAFQPSRNDEQPVAIARQAVEAARAQSADVLVIDTAGRLHVDADMMTEISELHRALTPAETLFVVDAMTGQDAATTAKAFADALTLTGVVLAKADADARGGAALSVRQVTGAPLKFLGVGEKTDALEPFHPERMASRILGMGDVLSLIEDAERKLDHDKADRLARKLRKGKRFDLEDFRDQLQQMKNLGGMDAMLDKIPGMGDMGKMAGADLDGRAFSRMEAIINSMTPHERRYPDVIAGSRKRRVANGSGTGVQDVNRLLKQHKQMQKMMKKMGKKGGMEKMMQGLSSGQQMPAAPPQRRRR